MKIETYKETLQKKQTRYIVNWLGALAVLLVIATLAAYLLGLNASDAERTRLQAELNNQTAANQLASVLPQLQASNEALKLTQEERQELNRLKRLTQDLRARITELSAQKVSESENNENKIDAYLVRLENLTAENEALKKRIQQLTVLADLRDNQINQAELSINASIALIEGLDTRFGVRDIGPTLVKVSSGNALYFMRTAQQIEIKVKPYHRCSITLTTIDRVRETASFDYFCTMDE